ncbi:MAG: TrmB family transcriptional regulator, partial [Nitrosotalea sp.]
SWGLNLLSQCKEVLLHALRKDIDIKMIIPTNLVCSETFHGLPAGIKIKTSDNAQNIFIFDDSEILMINGNNGKGAIFHSNDVLGTNQVKSFDQIWKNGIKISNLGDMTKSDAQEALKAIQLITQNGLGYVLNSMINSKNKAVDILNFLNKNGIDLESKTLDEIISLVDSTLDITCSGHLRYEPNANHFVIESKINSGHSIPWALLLEGYLNKKGIKTKMIYNDHVHSGERIHIKVDSKISMSS